MMLHIHFLFSFLFVDSVPFWSAKLKEQRLMFGECCMVSIVAKELSNVL